jgi:hypothetical protein
MRLLLRAALHRVLLSDSRDSNPVRRISDEFLVSQQAVHLSGVEEGDAAVDGGADKSDAVLMVDCRAAGVADPRQPSPMAETFGPLLPSVDAREPVRPGADG